MDQVPAKVLRDFTALVPHLINLVNLSVKLSSKSIYWLLDDMDFCHERVKGWKETTIQNPGKTQSRISKRFLFTQ